MLSIHLYVLCFVNVSIVCNVNCLCCLHVVCVMLNESKAGCVQGACYSSVKVIGLEIFFFFMCFDFVLPEVWKRVFPRYNISLNRDYERYLH